MFIVDVKLCFMVFREVLSTPLSVRGDVVLHVQNAK
jgi:hypothetical protein